MFWRICLGVVITVLAGSTVLAEDLWRRRPGEAYGPDSYCQWNRTGLPAAQQEICAQRDQAAAAGQKTASKQLLAFEADHDRAMKTLAQANAAVMCGLRSQEWGRTFQDAITQAADEDIRRDGLSDAEIATANVTGQRIYRATMAKTNCRSLRASEDLEKLDRLQWKLSGGYH